MLVSLVIVEGKISQKKLNDSIYILQELDARNNLVNQPIEYRNLFQTQQSMAQGSLEMILDVLSPSEANTQMPLNIKPPENLFYEIR